jgi:GTP-binding protein
VNLNKIDFKFAAGTSSQLPQSTLPEVVFSGRSNVGKSSLINKLCNRKALARVSASPGKTATINFFSDDEFYLVDLPGYGYAKVSHSEKKRWAELVEGYFAQTRSIALVVQIIDTRHKPSQQDMQMLSFLEQSGLPYITVLTKKDKLNKTQLAARLSELEEELDGLQHNKLFPFSALSGEGKDEILEYIQTVLNEFEN